VKKKITSIFFASQPNTGIGLVEVLVVVAIIAIALVALAGVGNFTLKTSRQLKNNLIAANLATELLEVVRAMKEGNWASISALSVDNPYHPVKVGSPLKWALAGDGENINGFSRQVVLNNVFRDSNDDIVASGGALDTGTKKIIVTVSWNDSGQNFQLVLISYLTNWKP
jgi:type II secretory pathway pseudopilin PulG